MALPPTPPLDIETMAELARRFAERRMLQEAADLYLVALRLDPKNLGLKLALAQVRQLAVVRDAGDRRRLAGHGAVLLLPVRAAIGPGGDDAATVRRLRADDDGADVSGAVEGREFGRGCEPEAV